jgi:Flp pilus assembly protein TadD
MLKTFKIRSFAPWILLGGTVFGVCPVKTQAPYWPAKADHSKSRLVATKTPDDEVPTAEHTEDADARPIAVVPKQTGDPAALAGIGAARIRQGNFIGAISYLERAQQTLPKDRAVATALETARFWFYMDEGHHSLVSNELAAAEKRYLSALELRPDSHEAFMGLRTTLLKARHAHRTMPPARRKLSAKARVRHAAISHRHSRRRSAYRSHRTERLRIQRAMKLSIASSSHGREAYLHFRDVARVDRLR